MLLLPSQDVVCPVEHLADMTRDLIELFRELGYSDASGDA